MVAAFVERGVAEPWSHQVAAAELAHSGRHVVLSTGTASGKSLAYQLPILGPGRRSARAGAVSVADQGARPRSAARRAVADGRGRAAGRRRRRGRTTGTAASEARRFARERSRWIFSNPDMIHLSLLRNHARWAVFLRNLRFIVVDECHYYRGIFGSNVAMVLRRLMRLCARYGGDAPGPTVIFASATTASPAATASELLGQHGHRGDRGRLAAGRTHGGPVGARAAHRPDRRERRAGASFGGGRGGPGDGRPDGRGRADADVRPIAPRRRAHRARRTGPARGRRTGAGRPRSPPTAPDTWPRTAAPWRARWPTGGCAGWPPPTPSNWAWTSPDWTPWCWPASPAPSPRSGSRPAGRAGGARAR